MNHKLKFKIGDWAWVYDDYSDVAGGGKLVVKPNEGSLTEIIFALISKLATCWTCPYNVLFVHPRKTGDGREVAPKIIL